MESGNPTKIQIAVTRTGTDTHILATSLASAGLDVIHTPLLKFILPSDWAEFDQFAADIAAFRWIVFTSVRAVNPFAERLNALSITCETETVVVGPATRAAAIDAGFNVLESLDVNNAAELAEQLLRLTAGDVLMPCGELTRGTLQKKLRDNGWTVKDPVVYRAVADETGQQALKLATKTVSAIVFTSGGAAQAALDVLDVEALNVLRVYSFGDSATDVLVPAGVGVQELPDFVTMEEFAKQIAIDLEQR